MNDCCRYSCTGDGRGRWLCDECGTYTGAQDPAIIVLSEPETDEWGDQFWPVDAPDLDKFAKVQIRDDGRVFVNAVPNPFRNPQQARALAAALLAAARKAEET